MKTLRILIALCIILGFATNNAISQKVIGEQTVHFYFTPTEIPCLTEVVSGAVVELQSFTNKTYHVKPRGVLHGETTGEDYEIKYEFNAYWPDPNPSIHWVMPILLMHDGKLVAVIHMDRHFVYSGQGVEIIERRITDVICK
jgi:hypothetical protein